MKEIKTKWNRLSNPSNTILQILDKEMGVMTYGGKPACTSVEPFSSLSTKIGSQLFLINHHSLVWCAGVVGACVTTTGFGTIQPKQMMWEMLNIYSQAIRIINYSRTTDIILSTRLSQASTKTCRARKGEQNPRNVFKMRYRMTKIDSPTTTFVILSIRYIQRRSHRLYHSLT